MGAVGIRSPKTNKRGRCSITISDIRDQENARVPRSALKSIVAKIGESMGELGLKAVIEPTE